jgi:hypothetical protein
MQQARQVLRRESFSLWFALSNAGATKSIYYWSERYITWARDRVKRIQDGSCNFVGLQTDPPAKAA